MKRIYKHKNLLKSANNIREFYLKNLIPIAIIFVVLILIPISKLEIIKVKMSLFQIQDLVQIVIGSLSSIFGIIFAVYILAFTMFEKNLSHLVYKKFINNPSMMKYVQYVIMTILVFLLLNTIIDDELSNYALNLSAFGALLYIGALISVFPLMKSLVVISKSDIHIKSLLDEINITTARNYINARSNEQIKGNPIFEITGLTNILINNNERIVLTEIINTLEDKIKESISSNDEQTTRDYIKGVLPIYKSLINASIKNSYYSMSEFIIKSYSSLKRFAVDNKLSYYIFYEFDILIEDTIDKFISIDYKNLIETYCYSVFSFLEYNIEHFLPPESEIPIFNFKDPSSVNKSYDYKLSSQWDLIANRAVSGIERLVEIASESNKYAMLSTVGYRYTSIISYVINSNLLGDKQKRYLLLYYDFRLKNLIEKLIKLQQVDSSLYFLNSFLYDNILEYDESIFVRYYNSYEDILILLYKSNQMSEYRLNELGALARGLPKYVEKYKVVPIILTRIMTLLQKLGEKHLENLSFDKISMYKEIHRQSDSIIRFAQSSKCNDEFVLKLIKIHSLLEDPAHIDNLIDDLDSLYETRLSDLI